jgi:hypothetical protein
MPDQKSDLGVHLIQGQLWNAFTYTSFSFKLNVTNFAPSFIDRLKQKIVVGLNTNQSFVLPHAIDREHQPITYAIKELNKNYLPAFVKFNETIRALIIQPTSADVVNVYNLQIDLLDSFGAVSTYYLNLGLYDSEQFQRKKVPLKTEEDSFFSLSSDSTSNHSSFN